MCTSQRRSNKLISCILRFVRGTSTEECNGPDVTQSTDSQIHKQRLWAQCRTGNMISIIHDHTLKHKASRTLVGQRRQHSNSTDRKLALDIIQAISKTEDIVTYRMIYTTRKVAHPSYYMFQLLSAGVVGVHTPIKVPMGISRRYILTAVISVRYAFHILEKPGSEIHLWGLVFVSYCACFTGEQYPARVSTPAKTDLVHHICTKEQRFNLAGAGENRFEGTYAVASLCRTQSNAERHGFAVGT